MRALKKSFSFLLLVALSLASGCATAETPKASPPTSDTAGFCGRSVPGHCATDADCVRAGCSGQLCQSNLEAAGISTCEYRDCYDAVKFQVQCGCINNGCRWHPNKP